jgi:hypothetical protein
MARKVFVLEEILAMLGVIGASKQTIANFQKQAEFVADKRPGKEYDDITVSSGFGQATQRGFVEFTLNDQLSQMDVKKAREVGYMLIEAAEAATSDEMFVRLLKDKVGLNDPDAVSRFLVELREIRQGTRGISRPM